MVGVGQASCAREGKWLTQGEAKEKKKENSQSLTNELGKSLRRGKGRRQESRRLIPQKRQSKETCAQGKSGGRNGGTTRLRGTASKGGSHLAPSLCERAKEPQGMTKGKNKTEWRGTGADSAEFITISTTLRNGRT